MRRHNKISWRNGINLSSNYIQINNITGRVRFTYMSLNVYFVVKEKYQLIQISQQTNVKFLNLMPIDIRHEKLIF